MKHRGRIGIWLAAGIVVFGLLGAGRASAAGPADFLKIAPATHEAFLYLDVTQARQSKLYTDLKSQLFDQNTSAQLAAIEQFTGVKLPDDIEAVAASGKIATNNEGCLYLRGRCDRQRILGMFATNPGYAEISKAGGKIINYTDDKTGTLKSLSFLTDNLVVIGDSSAVEAALAAFAGQGKTLDQNPAVKAQMAEIGASPTAMVIALRPQQAPPGLAEVPGLQNLQSLLLLLVDGSEAMTVIARVQADSVQTAGKWLDIVRGVIAMGQIQNKFPKLTEIANQVTASQRGSVVEVKAQLKVADTGDFLRQRIAEGRAQRPNVGGRRVRGGGGKGPAEPATPPQW